MRLSQFDQGGSGMKTSKKLYLLAGATAVFLVASFAFYIFGSITELGDLPGNQGKIIQSDGA